MFMIESMNKREYAQANKDWLEAKSKEEWVKALSKGILFLKSNYLEFPNSYAASKSMDH